jgi:flagellar M-ring protein FliF
VVLQAPQIFGIQRLVAAAVPGLDIGRVVVTDQHGITLSASDALTVGGATGEGRLSMKREVEEYVTRKIVALLDRAYGPGRAIVSVDATLNFDEVRRTVQDLMPSNGQNVRRRRQTTAGTAGLDPAATFQEDVTPRGTTDTEYDYGRRVEQVVAAPGGVTRLSIGVIIPGALDAATQERIEDLVRVAAGLNEARGDQVIVQNLDGIGSVGAVTLPESVSAPIADETAAAQPVPAKATTGGESSLRLQPWHIWAGGGLLLLLVISLLLLRRPGGTDAQLTADERARLLADVKATLAGRPA